MKTVFNEENVGHVTNEYPIFLGAELGLFDTVNIKYPELEQLYQIQLSQMWNEYEVDLTQDKMDMLRMPKEVVDLMVFTISWQYLIDSVAAKSITSLLIQYCTNSEAEGLLTLQALFEVIHARTYSHIVKQTFVDPNQMIRDTYKNSQVLLRSRNTIKVFNELANLPADADEETKRRAILKVIAVLMGLEAISFMASFAVTFAIAETDCFQGIANLVRLICRDEMLHARMDFAILSILRRSEVWEKSFQAIKHEIKEVFDLTVERELSWTDYLFGDGRQIVGLNATVLKEFVYYLSAPVYSTIGEKSPWPVVKENPLSYMEKFINSSGVQSAAQEIQITNYNTGAIIDDTDDIDFGFGDDNL